jgi:hypothetical protein
MRARLATSLSPALRAPDGLMFTPLPSLGEKWGYRRSAPFPRPPLAYVFLRLNVRQAHRPIRSSRARHLGCRVSTPLQVLVAHLADPLAEPRDVQRLVAYGCLDHGTRKGLAPTGNSTGLLSGTIRIVAMTQQQVPQVRSYQG